MKNSDMPAIAFQEVQGITGGMITKYRNHTGLTKREQACITLGAPETGDPDLDEIIMKSERKRIASLCLPSIISSLPQFESLGYLAQEDSWYAAQSIDYADALLEELSK